MSAPNVSRRRSGVAKKRPKMPKSQEFQAPAIAGSTRKPQPLYTAPSGTVPSDFRAKVMAWLRNNQDRLTLSGSGGGNGNHWVISSDIAPLLLGTFRAALMDCKDDALATLGMDPFEDHWLDIRACMYHHECFFHWHTDEYGAPDSTRIPSRALSFVYHMFDLVKPPGAKSPRPMFTGGELQFENGLTLEPEDGRLIMFNPSVRHRVLPVKCYSRDPMHGRWTLTGWLHKKILPSGVPTKYVHDPEAGPLCHPH